MRHCVAVLITLLIEVLVSLAAAASDSTEAVFRLRAEEKRREVDAGSLTACEAMAQLYATIGGMTKWDLDTIVLYTARVLAPGVSLRNLVIVPPGSLPHVSLGYSGFRSQYLDTPPSSQSHHFVGYFALGAKLPVGLVTEFFTECRELGLRTCLSWAERGRGDEPGDYQLGVVAANLAQKLKEAPALVRGLDGAIRATICEPEAVVPLSPPSSLTVQ